MTNPSEKARQRYEQRKREEQQRPVKMDWKSLSIMISMAAALALFSLFYNIDFRLIWIEHCKNWAKTTGQIG